MTVVSSGISRSRKQPYWHGSVQANSRMGMTLSQGRLQTAVMWCMAVEGASNNEGECDEVRCGGKPVQIRSCLNNKGKNSED